MKSAQEDEILTPQVIHLQASLRHTCALSGQTETKRVCRKVDSGVHSSFRTTPTEVIQHQDTVPLWLVLGTSSMWKALE